MSENTKQNEKCKACDKGEKEKEHKCCKHNSSDCKEHEQKLIEQEEIIAKLQAESEENKIKAAQYLNTASYYKNEAETCKKDFERFKERNKNIESEAKKNASEVVAKKLLPILDNFDQAISQVDAEVMRGFVMIYSSLQNVLSELGLVEIVCKNEKLNPELHNCISAETTEKEELDGIIAQVYQKGYKFAESNEIVRPSTVSVYKFNQ